MKEALKYKEIIIALLTIIFVFYFYGTSFYFSQKYSCLCMPRGFISYFSVLSSTYVYLSFVLMVFLFKMPKKILLLSTFWILPLTISIFHDIFLNKKIDEKINGLPMEVKEVYVNHFGPPAKGNGCTVYYNSKSGKITFDHVFREEICKEIKKGDTILVLSLLNCNSINRPFNFSPTKEELEKFSTPHYVLYKGDGKIYSSLDSLPKASQDVIENMGTREECEEELPWWYIDF